MLRRVHTSRLVPGLLSLDKNEAHHLRDVLRLKIGDRVEVFDDGGLTGNAEVTICDSRRVTLRIDQVVAPSNRLAEIIVASAIPKGERADWMIEKLSELGVSHFVPLITARSVVEPGRNKLERWQRIATESAKQSRRAGVMMIDESTQLQLALGSTSPSPRVMAEEVQSLYLSAAANVVSISDAMSSKRTGSYSLFIGPEGGWTDSEIALFEKHNLTAARLTATILRVETAAVAAAAIAAVLRDSHSNDP